MDPLGLLLDLLGTVLASLGHLLDALAYILGPAWPHLGGLDGQYARSLVPVHRIDGSRGRPGRMIYAGWVKCLILVPGVARITVNSRQSTVDRRQ